jgi:hypothetical protein
VPRGLVRLTHIARLTRTRIDKLQLAAGKAVRSILVRQHGRAIARRVQVVTTRTAERLIAAALVRKSVSNSCRDGIPWKQAGKANGVIKRAARELDTARAERRAEARAARASVATVSAEAD